MGILLHTERMEKVMKQILDGTVLRFLLVGILNTFVGAGTMFMLYNLLNCSYWISSAANYVVGGVVSFFLNKYFTFQNKEWSWAQVGKFVVNVVLCYVIAYAAAKPLVMHLLMGRATKIQENIAMLAGMCLYTALNYFGQRFFAFRK
jgi:putative flippase GtrA